jgi:hypothetical protein
MMGYGAWLAFGCNVGAYFSGIASTSLHGWLWIACALLGTAVATAKGHKVLVAQLPGVDAKALQEAALKLQAGLGDGGAFEDYAFWAAGTPSACLELFSSDRFIPASIAAKIVDLLTPKVFSAARSMTQNSDMFPIYENYVHSLLKEALRLKSGKNDEGQIVSASSP